MASPDSRVFQFTYEVQAQDFPTGEAVDIHIPMPAQYVGQKILVQSLQSSVPGESGVERTNGNAFYRLHRPADNAAPLSATLSWTVKRDAVIATGDKLPEAQLAQYLAPNALVPVGPEILQPILAEIHAKRKDDSPAATARAIYDGVVDNVDYKKSAPAGVMAIHSGRVASAMETAPISIRCLCHWRDQKVFQRASG